MEKKYLTENNVAIYSYPNENLHSFCLSLYVKYGCLFESADENGMAHLIEHAAFRNINHMMDGELYHTLDKCGLTFNATTYKEFIHFYINGSPKHFKTAAEILANVLAPIDMPASEYEIEKKRVKAEIREDNYKTTLECFTNNIVWKNTPLMRSICGTCTSVDSITKNKLAECHSRVFSSDNIFFYLTGSVSERDVDYVSALISRFELKSGYCNENVAVVPDGFGNRNGEVYLKNSSYSMVRFSFDIDTSLYKDAEMELFFDVMFSGESCIMFQNLSEKSGLIYGYDARFSKHNNIGNIYFSYEVQGPKVYETVSTVIESLSALKGGITNELDYAVAPYVDNAMILYDNPEEFNWNRAYEGHILKCGYDSIEDRITAFSAVTPENITKIARDVLKPSNLVVTMKANKNKIDLHKIRSIVKKL